MRLAPLHRSFIAVTIFFATFSLNAVAPAMADEAPWRLSAVEGTVRVSQPGMTLVSATPNQVLQTGAVVTTGAESRAVLDNGRQRITLASNSRLAVAPDSSNGMTRILQDLGSSLFQVDHRSAPHFRVETPLLAAVVKGTTFTVTADGQRDTVHVVQGLVEVLSNADGMAEDVPTGATAQVSRGNEGVHLITPAALPHLAPSSATALPTLNYSTVSDGVVANSGAQSASSANVIVADANGTAATSYETGANQNSAAQNSVDHSGANQSNNGNAYANGNSGSSVSVDAGVSSGNANANGNGNGNANGNSGNGVSVDASVSSGNGNNGNGNGNANGNSGNGVSVDASVGNGNNGNGNGNANGNGGNGVSVDASVSTGNGNNGNANGNANGNNGNGVSVGVSVNNGNGNANGNGNGNGNGGGNGNANGKGNADVRVVTDILLPGP